MPDSLEQLQQQRTDIVRQISELGDLRPGSITSTSGRCGKPSCRCHRPGQPGHGPHTRLTYKAGRKTVTESLPTPAAVGKAEREVGEFRKFQQLSREFVEVNTRKGGIHLLGPHATCWGRTSNSLPRADGTAPDRLVRRSEAGGRTAVRALVNADD